MDIRLSELNKRDFTVYSCDGLCGRNAVNKKHRTAAGNNAYINATTPNGSVEPTRHRVGNTRDKLATTGNAEYTDSRPSSTTYAVIEADTGVEDHYGDGVYINQQQCVTDSKVIYSQLTGSDVADANSVAKKNIYSNM